MGWLFMNRSAMGEHNTPKRYLDNQFTFLPDAARGRKYGMRVIKSAHTSAGYFAAVQNYNDLEERPAFARVCLVKWRPSAATENFGYTGDTFMVGKGYGSLTFKPTDDIGIYTIRNVMDREWSLVAA